MNTRYQNKNIAVLGAGLSGTAAALLLRANQANVSVLDSATENKLPESTIKNLRDHGVRVISGPDAETNRDSYQLVVLSPGIDPESPLAQNFSSRKIDIIAELELGWQFCQLPVIAITGTNGKTTTTELVAQTLNACGQRTVACGNIGKPLSAVVRDQSKFDVLTVEVSSFQLETIKSFRPQISVWLNFAPDHLDRYASVAEYRAAKLRIFDYQTEKEFAVVNASEQMPPI
ncbi:MAG TPA: UDP-N-acetylmuramoyl-L-alanine--D-glutamate ligase, partial [Chthoniobacterales bacterium]|nr:UDP-N-acetylmuramoyl-L-alanine--D-glutamate ligase [Chthoniobacterales bacterium]